MLAFSPWKKTGLEGECSKKVWNSGLLMQTLERWVAALSRTSRAFLSAMSNATARANATFIVLLELCFSAFLILLVELYANQSGNVPNIGEDLEIWRIVSFALSLIAFWMAPNLFMWSRANQIERDFARRPNLYSSNSTASTDRKLKRRH